MTDVTLRYDGAINGIGWGTAGGILGGFASLDTKPNYQTQHVGYYPEEHTLDDGTTVTGRFEVIVHVSTTEADLDAARDELATDIYGMGLPDLAASREEAKEDMTTDLFSVPVAQIEGALGRRNIGVSRDEVRDALEGIDQHGVYQDVRDGLSYERWDRSAPVDGTPADQMQEREQVPDSGPIYLVRDEEGALVYFQYVDAIDGGKLDEAGWESSAEQHLGQIAEQRSASEIIQTVIDAL